MYDFLYCFSHKVMQQSKNPIIQHCFPSTEPDSKKRPETVRSVSSHTVDIQQSCVSQFTCLSLGGDSV